MPNITKKLIDIRKPPTSGQIFVWDDQLIGFGVRFTPSAIAFIAESRIKGMKRRLTIGRYPLLSVEDARLKAREFLLQMANGVDPYLQKKQERIASVTLFEVLEVYLSTKQLKASTVVTYRRMVKHAFKAWLHLPVVELTKDMIEDRHREMANGTRYGTSGKAYANGSFKILQALLNFAAEKYEVDGEPLLPVNPVSRLTKTRAWYRVHPRSGVVPEHKMGQWYRSVKALPNKTVSDYFLFLLFTGLRRQEGLLLKWTDVDFDAKTLTVRREQAKNHIDHVLPLSEFLLDLLYERHRFRANSPYVFPGRFNKGHLSDFRVHLLEAREKSGCNFMIHDLRRTFLSCAERLELPYYVLKRLANHKVSSDTMVPYIVVSMERLRAHMERISRHFLDLVQSDEAAS